MTTDKNDSQGLNEPDFQARQLRRITVLRKR
jgi:hypothetical protein